jgi:hypothetical protein
VNAVHLSSEAVAERAEAAEWYAARRPGHEVWPDGIIRIASVPFTFHDEREMNSRSVSAPARSSTRARLVGARRWLAIVAATVALAGCAVPFGENSGAGARDWNRLYLQEQERTERFRQTLVPGVPSDR